MKPLTQNDLLKKIQKDVYVQNYQPSILIQDVKIIEIKVYSSEDGTFEDLIRLDEKGFFNYFPKFQLKQINRSKIIPGAIKAWHLHFNQEDIWYVPPEAHMILGLWDLREKSKTKDLKMKIVMGNGVSKIVYVPRGVAHGVVNISKKPGEVIYFVNQIYDKRNPDERRLPWDALGSDFWEIEKG
ncbi:MAG: dTDP-4-dehydrorhamnose 3,5-epimerase family protein [Microgenomates group bacterium]|nr:dTDP-4-dehydrorhamnose 3,5-epimerase family protein [Microgenomates group bacterium]